MNVRDVFSRQLPQKLVDEIVQNPQKVILEGELRKVTVLFADIKGFSSFSESIQPREVVSLLNTFFTGLTDIVFKHEGTLDKYIGDALMAVFGAPFSHPNDTERAIITAFDMMEYVDELNRGWLKTGRERIGICIGIDSGTVIAGNMGSTNRIEYSVLGEVVKRASLLKARAEEGQILTTQAVYEEAQYLVEAQLLDYVSLKRNEKFVNVYELKDLLVRKYIRAVEKGEPYKVGHYLNLARDAESIGEKLGFSEKDLVRLKTVAMLIDVGRLGLNEDIFNKKEKLNPQEFEVVKSHVLRGAEYMEKKLRLFKEGVEAVKHHHEFYDGSGYPDGLKGKQIPLWARILCVVDNFHAMTSKRPFREPLTREEAMNLLEKGKKRRYDPKITDIYLSVLKEREENNPQRET